MEQGKIVKVNRAYFLQKDHWLDEVVFESIFTEQYPRVYGVVFRLVGDRDEADDLCAEAFWRLWQNPPPRDENVAGWLYRVVTRLGYNALRSSKRRAQYEAQTLPGDLDSPDPSDQVEVRLERLRVRAVLRQMPLRDVQILILRHSGLAYKDIAAALNLKPSSIGSLLTRAEEKFEKLYLQGDQHASKR